MIKSVVNIEAPRPQVFSILTDFPSYTKWLPGCQQCSVAATSGSTVDTDLVVASLKTMKMSLRFDIAAGQSLTFKLIRGSDIKGYSGSYRLMDAADGKGTVVISELEIDAGPLAPRFIVDRIVKKAIDDTVGGLKKYLKTLPPPAAPATTPAPKPAAAARPRRARRILQMVKTPTGYRVWYMGQTFLVKG